MTDFSVGVGRYIGKLAFHYRLTMEVINSCEVLLIGNGFALSFMNDRDGVLFGMIERDKKSGELRWYSANHLLIERSIDMDSASFGNPVGMDERLDASLRVLHTILEKHCHDLLVGDFSWLHKKIGKDPEGWKGRSVSADSVRVLNAHGV